jgi:hypothetical protein
MPHRLIQCRCLLDNGQRLELFVISAGCCAAVCELMDAIGSQLRRVSARLWEVAQ